jgi:hypothetical protein
VGALCKGEGEGDGDGKGIMDEFNQKVRDGMEEKG